MNISYTVYYPIAESSVIGHGEGDDECARLLHRLTHMDITPYKHKYIHTHTHRHTSRVSAARYRSHTAALTHKRLWRYLEGHVLQLVRSLLEQEGLHLHRSCLEPLEMVYGK